MSFGVITNGKSNSPWFRKGESEVRRHVRKRMGRKCNIGGNQRIQGIIKPIRGESAERAIVTRGEKVEKAKYVRHSGSGKG